MRIVSGKVRLSKYLGYTYVTGDVEDVLALMKAIRDSLGRNTEDVNDTIRILEHFEEFYETMKRRSKDYIAPKKSEADLVRGVAVVEKIRLMKEQGVNKAIIIFDKRVDDDLLRRAASEAGIELLIE